MKKIVFIVLVSFLLLGVASELQKKIIRNKDFDIECYVSLKPLKNFEDHKMYYWFKSGEIHKSLSSTGGLVLHDRYKKFYRTNQLAEEGTFNYGLKNGIWKDWYENGNLKSELEYRDGYRHGEYLFYDIFGTIEERGVYRNDMKTGQWVNYKTQDTLDYKKNVLIIADTTNQKNGFFKRLFTKRDSIQKVQDKQERQLKRKNDSIAKVMKKQEKENKKEESNEGFFKRVFSKKEDKKAKSSH